MCCVDFVFYMRNGFLRANVSVSGTCIRFSLVRFDSFVLLSRSYKKTNIEEKWFIGAVAAFSTITDTLSNIVIRTRTNNSLTAFTLNSISVDYTFSLSAEAATNRFILTLFFHFLFCSCHFVVHLVFVFFIIIMNSFYYLYAE